ncbi:MAG: hypothetical protein J3K34DRAFT_459261 [Monoraphidium minutum]|nr:MAG: hypothetical protein J3K34DRAFT_459261 [Monoraphidium minutum]
MGQKQRRRVERWHQYIKLKRQQDASGAPFSPTCGGEAWVQLAGGSPPLGGGAWPQQAGGSPQLGGGAWPQQAGGSPPFGGGAWPQQAGGSPPLLPSGSAPYLLLPFVGVDPGGVPVYVAYAPAVYIPVAGGGGARGAPFAPPPHAQPPPPPPRGAAADPHAPGGGAAPQAGSHVSHSSESKGPEGAPSTDPDSSSDIQSEGAGCCHASSGSASGSGGRGRGGGGRGGAPPPRAGSLGSASSCGSGCAGGAAAPAVGGARHGWAWLDAALLRRIFAAALSGAAGPPAPQALRLACRNWRAAHDASIAALAPQVLRTKGVAAAFPALRALDLTRCRNVRNRDLFLLAEHAGALALEALSIDDDALKPWVSNKGLASVGRVTTLHSLSLHGCNNVTNNGLAHLATLRGLTRLSLRGCKKVSNSGLAALQQGLTQLRDLDLHGCTRVSCEGAGLLAALPLRRLALGLTRVRDAGLGHVARLSQLTELRLAREGVTDAGVSQLAALTRLSALTLKELTGVTGAALVTLLRSLPRLAHLDLSKSLAFGDPELSAAAAALPALASLRLRGTPVTAAGVAALGGLAGLTQLCLADLRDPAAAAAALAAMAAAAAAAGGGGGGGEETGQGQEEEDEEEEEEEEESGLGSRDASGALPTIGEGSGSGERGSGSSCGGGGDAGALPGGEWASSTLVGLLAAVEHLPALQELDLSNASPAADASAPAAAVPAAGGPALAALTALDLSGRRAPAALLRALAAAAPRLRALAVRGCPVGGAEAASLRAEFPSVAFAAPRRAAARPDATQRR